MRRKVGWPGCCWLLLVPLGLLPGCQQKMAVQPSYKPLSVDSFFSNGQSARPLVKGTVARGHLRIDRALFEGRRTSDDTQDLVEAATLAGLANEGLLPTLIAVALAPTDYVEEFPFPVTKAIMENGRHRYMIYCVVCHDPVGTGHGKIVERGYTPPPSYHIDRLRTAPVGYFFNVITNGYGSMPSYAAQVPVRDRWAIISYIRALQLSQHYPQKPGGPQP